ncbi:MAG: hypothetical protein OEW08_01350 [Gammaproteobacteria bacterium]|nr:hypothetical protein [Gammaproteobacteria bacterium]
MAWKFDNPLVSLADDQQNAAARGVWEGESLGGITEDNNRLPVPVVGLLILTIVTSFLVTFPLWGQRPTAALYEDYIALMDSPQVQALPDDAKRMQYIVDTVRAKGTAKQPQLDRHPLSMDDLRLIQGQVVELQRQGARMEEFTVLGNRLVLANFEGNWRADGTRERVQPWWDKGYTIDVFYIIAFCVSVIVVVKRLPPYTWQPKHKH